MKGAAAALASRTPIALGLVGAGRWGTRYMSTLRELEGVRLALVASRSPAARERIPAGCELTADWRHAVGAGGLDGIILATPPALHHEMAMACVTSGLAVLVEKPLTLDGPSARALREAASARGVLVMVDHTHVFSAAFETLKARARRLEPPLRIRSLGGNRGPIRADVDGLWDYGPHDVSLCLDLVGCEPAAVQAHALAGAGDAGGGIGVTARLEFPGDVVAELTFGNGLPEKRRRFEVEGKDGALLYDDLAEPKLVERDSHGRLNPISVSPTPPLSRAVLAFRDAILSGCREHPSLRLGVSVVETLERIASGVGAGGAAER